MSQSRTDRKSSGTYLDHDHGERVDIGFLTGILPAQDLWCRPQWSVEILTRSGPDGVEVLGHNSKAEVRNACARGVVNDVYENVEL
jgi:hypothetical protein